MAGSDNFTRADEQTLMNFANGMNGPLQTLEANLSTLGTSQGTLDAAFKGKAGRAVYDAFGNVLDTGRQVAAKIEEIINAIKTSAAEFDHQDAAALQKVLAGMESGGYTDSQVNPKGAYGDWVDGKISANWS